MIHSYLGERGILYSLILLDPRLTLSTFDPINLAGFKLRVNVRINHMNIIIKYLKKKIQTLLSRYLMANTGGVEHPSNCPEPCLKVLTQFFLIVEEVNGGYKSL